MCSLLVVGAALAVSANVSDHLARAAMDEAVASTEAVVRGLRRPDDGRAASWPTSRAARRSAIDDELERLVASGKILRIKIWRADGTVVASDLPVLRGRHFVPDDDLARGHGGPGHHRLLGRVRRRERVRARPRRRVPRDVPADPTPASERADRRLRDLPGRRADPAPDRPDAARRAPDRRGDGRRAAGCSCSVPSPGRRGSSPARTATCAAARSASARSSGTRSTSR